MLDRDVASLLKFESGRISSFLLLRPRFYSPPLWAFANDIMYGQWHMW
jgi:hypothetical protein